MNSRPFVYIFLCLQDHMPYSSSGFLFPLYPFTCGPMCHPAARQLQVLHLLVNLEIFIHLSFCSPVLLREHLLCVTLYLAHCRGGGKVKRSRRQNQPLLLLWKHFCCAAILHLNHSNLPNAPVSCFCCISSLVLPAYFVWILFGVGLWFVGWLVCFFRFFGWSVGLVCCGVGEGVFVWLWFCFPPKCHHLFAHYYFRVFLVGHMLKAKRSTNLNTSSLTCWFFAATTLKCTAHSIHCDSVCIQINC